MAISKPANKPNLNRGMRPDGSPTLTRGNGGNSKPKRSGGGTKSNTITSGCSSGCK